MLLEECLNVFKFTEIMRCWSSLSDLSFPVKAGWFDTSLACSVFDSGPVDVTFLIFSDGSSLRMGGVLRCLLPRGVGCLPLHSLLLCPGKLQKEGSSAWLDSTV